MSNLKSPILNMKFAIVILMTLAFSACNDKETPQVGTSQAALISVTNNCDKDVHIQVLDTSETKLYISEYADPHSKIGPFSLTKFKSSEPILDTVTTLILINRPGLVDSVVRPPDYRERIYFDPSARHIFTINADYSIDYTLQTAIIR